MKTFVAPISTDGDIRIPDEIREHIGGDEVTFVVTDEGVVVLQPNAISLEGIFGPMPGHEGKIAYDRERNLSVIMRLNNAESFKKLLGA